MTERWGAPLGFCEHCGTKRMMVGQVHCVSCGWTLTQPAELTPGYIPPAVLTPPAPIQASATLPEAAVAAPMDPPPASAADPTATPPWLAAEPGSGAATPPAAYSNGYPPPYGPAAGFGQPPTPTPWDGSSPYPGIAPARRRNRALVPVLLGIGLVAIVALAGGMYVVASSKSGSSSSNPIAAGASKSAGSPATAGDPTPAVNATPASTTGILTGAVLSDAGAPMPGVGVILCRKSVSGCTIDGSLVATGDASGQFEIDGIPTGSYVVLYSPTGVPGSAVDGLKVDIDDQSASCIASGFLGSAPASCQGSIPLLSSDSGLKLIGEASFTVTGSGMSLASGALYSPKLGLCLNYENGNPISVDVTAGNTVTIQITDRKTA